jgi:hypothetical protein
VLVALLVLGLAASGRIAWERHRVESAYRAVEIAVDSEDWRILAVREGQDGAAFWQQLRRMGAGSVAVYDSTLGRLADAGLVAYLDGATLLAQARTGRLGSALQPLAAGADPRVVYVLPASAEVASLIHSGFATALGPDRVERVRDAPPVYRVRGRLRDVEETGLGFLPSAVAAWEEAGFRVILRPRNARGMTAEGLQERVRGYEAFGRGRTFIFDLAEVLGFEYLVNEAAGSLRAIDGVYGRPEILTAARRMRGEEAMARLMRPDAVRVFSIAPEELHRIEMPQAIDRYIRGARERNLRLLYVRPFLSTPGGVNAVEHNLAYLGGIVSGVRDAGFALGVARPLPAPAIPRGLLYGSVLAAVVAVVWLAVLLAGAAGVRVPVWSPSVLTAAGVLAAAALSAAGYGEWMRKLSALGAAIAFPTLAVFYGVRGLWSGNRSPGTARGLLGTSVIRLWAVSAGSALGGLVVGALLAEWSFMLAFDVFLGVKIAIALPIAVVGVLWALESDREAPGGSRGLVNRAREVLDQPLTLRVVVVGVLVGGMTLLLLLRTGNIGVPVLEVEERLREALERALVARPRTKEYLLGHPALMLGLAAGLAGSPRWAIPLILVGTIGQVGLVNSFAHAHTPLLYTVWRTFNALALGTALGAALLVAGYALRRSAVGVRESRAGRRGSEIGDQRSDGPQPISDLRYPISNPARYPPRAVPPRPPSSD